MKTNKFSFSLSMLLTTLMLTVLVACQKEDPNKDLDAPRLFKPGGISVKTGQTSANVTWTAPVLSTNLKLSYLTEFSQDSTFATTEFSLQTDTIGVVVTDEKLTVRKKYFVRVKALSAADRPESNWQVSTGFSISGEQLFLPLRELEIKETEITLYWKPTEGLDKISLTPIVGGTAADFQINASEAQAGSKVFTGLPSGTTYLAEIFQGSKSKGILTVATLSPTVYAIILNPGDDLNAAINAAGNQTTIGLNPGTYSAGNTIFNIVQKTITLKSTSSNPKDTKVNFREFTLRGTGAGLVLDGIEFDGTPSGSGYFINLTGVKADAELADFSKVEINNCIVHGATTSFMRANRGAVAAYTIDKIIVKNSLVFNIGSALNYIFFHLDKLKFNTLDLTKSTFNDIGQALLSCSTVIPGTPPIVTIDYCTFNNFGANNRYVLMDANANPVRFNMMNSIIANVPRDAASVNGTVIRATGVGSGMTFNNNNTFNFTNGSGASLAFPTTNTTQSGNQSINLGWTATTVDFTLPLESPLRASSSAGAAIGDPRWTY